MTRKQRQAEADRLMAALTDGEATLITEGGDVQAGGMPEEDIGADAVDVEFFALYKGCPRCAAQDMARNDERLPVGREIWSICREHRVKWLSLRERFPCEGSEEEWAANLDMLRDYRFVLGHEVFFGEVAPDRDAGIAAQESYTRLWRILQTTRPDPALLAWILEAHTDLPPDLAWLIHRRLAGK
jgi:hypothetical protein